MELLLIRHALPVRRELTTGAADPELSEVGLQQARHLADYLSSERLDAVYTSPLRRALETAAPVALAQGRTTVVIDGVAEWDRHASEYIPIEELKASGDPRWAEIVRGTWQAGELSPLDFRTAVVAEIEALIDAHAGERIAVVCHGGVIAAYVTAILGLADPQPFFYPNYTSIHRVAAARTGERSIVTLNETAHLRSTGLPMGLFQGATS
ncbi:MAG: histidine phosphatase family protein [Actinobacteria bacterium]|nr:histidine phosphatase family protein [Actinomycetota bacterium]